MPSEALTRFTRGRSADPRLVHPRCGLCVALWHLDSPIARATAALGAMIIYSRGWQSLLTLRIGRGSPLTRNLLVPTLSVVMTALLFQYTCKHVVEPFAVAESGEDVGDEPIAGTCSSKWSLHPGPVRAMSRAVERFFVSTLTTLRRNGCLSSPFSLLL